MSDRGTSESGAMGLAGAGEPGPAFFKLDTRVIHLWRVQHLIASFVLLGFALIAGAVTVAEYRPAWPWVAGAWLVLAVARVILLFWYPARAYTAWCYRVDAHVLETKHGIWFQTMTLLPLSRLQHVDLSRGPLERMFGLATLILYTAGTHHAMVAIPGLEAAEAARLRDYLVTLGKERLSDGI